jgi:hypothetical protein
MGDKVSRMDLKLYDMNTYFLWLGKDLQLITYFMWVGDGRDGVSGWLCS